VAHALADGWTHARAVRRAAELEAAVTAGFGMTMPDGPRARRCQRPVPTGDRRASGLDHEDVDAGVGEVGCRGLAHLAGADDADRGRQPPQRTPHLDSDIDGSRYCERQW
jgi:hypothetical protein